MVNDAVAHYHELLNDRDLASESLALLDAGLESAKLIFGGRRLSPYLRPHFVAEEDFAQVVRVCETVWSAIEKVKDAAVSDESLLIELGLTEIERELVKIDPGYRAVSPTARLDSFLTDEVYSFVELNGESPAGIAYADAAYEIYARLPVMKRFAVANLPARLRSPSSISKACRPKKNSSCFASTLKRKVTPRSSPRRM